MEVSIKRRISASQPLETAIQIGLAAVLVAGCILILRPFIPMLMWGIIIAIASYPTFLKFERRLGGRRTLASVLWTLVLLAVLIIPLVLLGQRVIQAIPPIVTRLREGTVQIPPPPANIEHWPIIGTPLTRIWSAASANLRDIFLKFAPQIKSAIPVILSATAAVGSTVVQFLLSIVLSGFLLANAQAAYNVTRALANRLFGEDGPEYQQLIGTTVRSVTFGVLGVALIQTACAAVGFFIVGLPGAGVWSVVFLAAAVLQFGALVLVPAVLYVFVIASTTKAVLFLLWCIVVATMDNVLKPMLLGRGAAVPIAVVFLGVIGGFMAMSIVGLFVGAVVLSVGYKLFLAWIRGGAALEAQP